ncbi:MAG: hypothetical protein EZS28_032563 [Streblomastix strix]|uniref:Uncharacterized protein n=1 Tax=Streblomastix strix TaxID=222440 RepID=A0A5J4UPG8_9EUKA|nr:MAG: hypothetical protein EZS28_032563 [Streblomastix strix]
MGNIYEEMRNRNQMNSTISEIDKELEINEYQKVGRQKVEDNLDSSGLMNGDILRQKREDKTTSSTDRQAELPQTPNKR